MNQRTKWLLLMLITINMPSFATSLKQELRVIGASLGLILTGLFGASVAYKYVSKSVDEDRTIETLRKSLKDMDIDLDEAFEDGGYLVRTSVKVRKLEIPQNFSQEQKNKAKEYWTALSDAYWKRWDSKVNSYDENKSTLGMAGAIILTPMGVILMVDCMRRLFASVNVQAP